MCVYMQKVELRYAIGGNMVTRKTGINQWNTSIGIVDTYGIKSTDSKDKLLLKSFAAFRAALM